MTQLFAGIDLGTSSIRAAAYDAHGNEVTAARWRLETRFTEDGGATQSPERWIGPVQEWLAETAGIVAWAVGGQMNTYCLADAAGRPLGEAITWQDRRRGPGDDGALPATALASRTMLMESRSPRAWADARYALLPKDVLLAALTGLVRGDRLSWNGVLTLGGDVSPQLPSDAARLLPELGDPTDGVASRYGRAVLGVPDTVAVVLGCGMRAGPVYSLTGTSETLIRLCDVPVPGHGFRSSLPIAGHWLHAGPSSVGGVTLQWAAGVLTGGDVSALVEAALGVDPHEDLPLFRPYLMGERTPLWDNALTAAWDGVRGSHGVPELAYAVIEGIDFSLRHGIAALELSSGSSAVGEVVATTSSVARLRFRADVLGMAMRGTEDPFVGCRGAAATAFAGFGGTDLTEASDLFGNGAGWHAAEPRPYPATRYDRWRRLALPH